MVFFHKAYKIKKWRQVYEMLVGLQLMRLTWSFSTNLLQTIYTNLTLFFSWLNYLKFIVLVKPLEKIRIQHPQFLCYFIYNYSQIVVLMMTCPFAPYLPYSLCVFQEKDDQDLYILDYHKYDIQKFLLESLIYEVHKIDDEHDTFFLYFL